MRAPSIHTIVLAAGALALASCSSTPAEPGSSSQTSKPTQASAALTSADSSLGKILVHNGDTVYVFTKDTKNSGTSTCTGECAAAWPPVAATTANTKPPGVSGTVGRITRPDGSAQLTVGGWPIYTYAADAKAGDVSGQGVKGVWFVVRPDGSMVKKAPAAVAGGY